MCYTGSDTVGDLFQLGHVENHLSYLQGIEMKIPPPPTKAQTEYRGSSRRDTGYSIEIERLFLDNRQQTCCRARGRKGLHSNTVGDGSTSKLNAPLFTLSETEDFL